MDRCRVCGHQPVDTVEYLETQLPGLETVDVVRVIVLFCDSCGWSDRRTSKAVPVPA